MTEGAPPDGSAHDQPARDDGSAHDRPVSDDRTDPPDRPPLAANRDWRLLWSSYGAANAADGILLAAGPLLVVELTRDPLLVALATAMQIAPTFVFSLVIGAVIDRAERRRLQAVAHLLRAVVLLGVAVAIATGALTLPVLYVALFALGTAEVAADTAGETLVAAVVPPAELGTASARLIGTSTVVNRLAGPPLGALLIGIGLAVPWLVNAVLLVAAAVLVSRMAVDGRPSSSPPAAAASRVSAGAAAPGAVGEDDPVLALGGTARLRRDIADGWRFTMRTPPVRRLAVLITVFNLTFGAVHGILVLWAKERLGLDEVGFGTLLTATAIGGFVGSVLFPRLERRFSYGTLLRAGLVTESATHFLLLSTTTPWFAGGVMVFFGVHEAVWGALAGAIRLKVVPAHVLGRVNSVYRLAIFTPLLVGVGIGGVLADVFGILAPFWYAGVGAALTTIAVWRSMDDLGSAAEHATA